MRKYLWLSCSLLVGLSAAPAWALTFNFTQAANSSLTASEQAAFQTAANAWSAVLTDNITVNLQIGFQDLGTASGGGVILGSTSATSVTVAYAATKLALIGDAKSSVDSQAVSNLPTTVVNGTSRNTVLLTTAQLKALGGSSSGSDGTILFTSNSAIQFADTRADLNTNTHDLIGVAEHEIGHVLGFESSVDIGPNTPPTLLDLFRYSGANTPSLTAGQAAYFSIDGGVTDLSDFSPGGSGNYQASHWTSSSTALMAPALATGRQQDITALDVTALDVIGYDVAVPEPGALGWLVVGVLGVAVTRSRHQRASAST